MATPGDNARRKWGVIFLIMAFALLVLGQTVLREWLGRSLGFLLYWLSCIGFTLLAILTALLDAWIVRTRARRDQTSLFRRTVLGERTSDDAAD